MCVCVCVCVYIYIYIYIYIHRVKPKLGGAVLLPFMMSLTSRL